MDLKTLFEMVFILLNSTFKHINETKLFNSNLHQTYAEMIKISSKQKYFSEKNTNFDTNGKYNHTNGQNKKNTESKN